MVGFRVALGHRRGQPIPVLLLSIGNDLYLRHDAASAFKQMVAAAAKDGVVVRPSEGKRVAFRFFDDQSALYDLYKSGKGNLAARPGWSNHEAGTTIDLDTDRGTNEAFRWLERNGALYGFYRTVASEPWHWEYLGINRILKDMDNE